MAIETNPTKNAQAAEIIASQIAKLPANTPMEHGTLGAYNGMTKREGEAYNMTLYFVGRLYGWTDINADDPEFDEKITVVKSIAAQAVEKSGK